jgi:uncharacterized protein (TIGR03435 family)
MTAVKGLCIFTLEWTPDNTHPPAEAPSGPSLFMVLQQQLGLKLEPKESIDVLSIESAERPSEN